MYTYRVYENLSCVELLFIVREERARFNYVRFGGGVQTVGSRFKTIQVKTCSFDYGEGEGRNTGLS